MKRKLKGATLLVLVAMIATVISACGKSENTPNNASPSNAASAEPTEAAVETLDPVTLKVMLFGDKPVDMDKVLAEFETSAKDTINTKLDMTFDVPAEYRNKLKLKLAAGEEIDLAFDAPWWDLNANIAKGYYHELDQYFNNDAYPGLKAAFSPEFLESNKIDGHIYAIPVTNAFYDVPVLIIRKDLREKYGLEPIKSIDELKVFLTKVNENEPDFVPFGAGRFTWYQTFANFTDKQTNFRAYPFEIGGTGALFNVVLSEDGKQVLGATTIGDPAADYANFPAPYNNADFFYSELDKKVEFRPFLVEDPLAQSQAPGLKFAAADSTLNGVAAARAELKKTEPNADYEIFVYNDAVRNMEPGAIGTGFKAWNFLTIPKTSKNVDRTMKFLDWLFSDPDNHDLFELGIEGTHWTKDGDKNYKDNENSNNYRFPGYEMTWNPTLSRINSNNDSDTLKYIDYEYKQESYYRLAVSGFNFNAEPVKTEIAKVQPKFDDFRKVVDAGLEPNWRQKAESLNKELRALGLDKIRAELIKQVQAYIDNGGN